MNALNQAAATLRKGRCEGTIKDGDRYCALGALGLALLGEAPEIHVYSTDKELDAYARWENSCYEEAGSSEEAKVLAATIMEQNPDHPRSDAWEYNWESHNYQAIIYTFNDSAESSEPVIAMFEKAAAKMEEKV